LLSNSKENDLDKPFVNTLLMDSVAFVRFSATH